MRKLLYLSTLLFAIFAQGQELQNANWCFGNGAGMDFLPDPFNPTSFTSAANGIEGCATVSDPGGNLQFYSNGVTVMNSNHQVMTNGTGLMGHLSSTQGVVIIPKPGDQRRYFIVTIDGVSGQRKGLYYSEIDMAASSGLGEVLSANKNTPLRDHNNIAIDNTYTMVHDGVTLNGIRSEKMTMAKHCNGVDYWLITQIADHVYAYLVTSSGIGLTPATISLAPFSINDDFIPSIGQTKVSPDGKRYAACVYLAFSDSDGDTGAVQIGDFNNATGEVTFDDDVLTIPFGGVYGLEFSPSSEFLYITSYENVHRTRADGSEPFMSLTPGLTGEKKGMQLAMNGKIYISDFVSGGTNMLSVINDPDNPVNPDYQNLSFALTNGTTQIGLPQRVLWHDPHCEPFNVLTVPEPFILPYVRAHSDYIETEQNYLVSNGQNITLQANNYILMEPNSLIASGSVFLAHIQECGLCEGSTGERQSLMQKSENESIDINEKLLLYPNPANTKVNLSVGSNIKHITVVSITGTTVLDYEITEQKEVYTLDISNYNTGVYFVRAITQNGETYIEKLIIE